MTVKWQRENAEGTLWSATVLDGQQGWFEIQVDGAMGTPAGVGCFRCPDYEGPGDWPLDSYGDADRDRPDPASEMHDTAPALRPPASVRWNPSGNGPLLVPPIRSS
jgi:hypothetical protein